MLNENSIVKAAMKFTEIKKAFETETNKRCTKVVLTVPANFKDLQRQVARDVTLDADLRSIDEATAAVFAYGLDNNGAEHALVYNISDNKKEVTLLEIEAGQVKVVERSANHSFLYKFPIILKMVVVLIGQCS
jgi:molecular chaperone HscA